MRYNKKKDMATVEIVINVREIVRDILDYDPSITKSDLRAWLRDTVADIINEYFSDGVASEYAAAIVNAYYQGKEEVHDTHTKR